MIGPLLFLAFSVVFHPAHPTVGDPITVEFPSPVTLDPSPDFEVVSTSASRVTVRTFEPRAISLNGSFGHERFTGLRIPVASVLAAKDKMAPAELKPPLEEPYGRRPLILIAIAGILALGSWGTVLLLWRRLHRAIDAARELPPDDRFRASVARLRADTSAHMRWARLADALRRYLAATTSIGLELTTAEVLIRHDRPVVATILHQGDLEKFAPWGAADGDFDGAAAEALALIPEPEPVEGSAGMTRFASPVCVLLVLLLVARIVLLALDRRRNAGSFVISSLMILGGKRSLRAATAGIPFVLECLGLLLLIAALARPQRVVKMASNDRYGIDIVVALDASGSMAAEDFRPRNRFTVAKELIADFISRRQDDRIGIVTFGARAATRVPITYDRDVAATLLQKADVGENGDGTAIGHAIATSVNRLRGSKARTRVIILVTDGVNNSGSIEPATAAQLATRFGIKIYTIGVGSRGEVPLPVKRINPLTGEIDVFYETIRADLDEESLTSIAKTTGGEYFRATDARAMSDVLRRIDALEKSRLSAPKNEKIDELYPLPLAMGILLLALSMLSGETLWQKVTA